MVLNNKFLKSLSESKKRLVVKNIKNDIGFTLIEVLVVVSVIGLLASLVFSSLTNAKVEAQYALANAEMNQFMKMVQYALGETGQNLAALTLTLPGVISSGCVYYSGCKCWADNPDLRNIPTDNPCFSNWQAVINKITETGGVVENVDHLLRDPWGSPYALQELEQTSQDCEQDRLILAGPDGKLLPPYEGDNIWYDFPPSNNPPCY